MVWGYLIKKGRARFGGPKKKLQQEKETLVLCETN